MGNEPAHRINESDIGSGEKSPGEQDTDRMIDHLKDVKQPNLPTGEGLASDKGPAQPGPA